MCVDLRIRPSGSAPGCMYCASLGLVTSTTGHCSNLRSAKLNRSWSTARSLYLQTDRFHLRRRGRAQGAAAPTAPARPAVVHPVPQLQLQGSARVPAVQDGHQASQRVQMAAKVSDPGTGRQMFQADWVTQTERNRFSGCGGYLIISRRPGDAETTVEVV